MKRRMAITMKWVGICLVGLGVLYAILYAMASRSLRRECEALRADGRPMTAAAIIPKEVPVADNAAPLYEAAVKMLKAEQPLALTGCALPDKETDKTLFDQAVRVAEIAISSPTNVEAAACMGQILRNEVVREAIAVIARGTARPRCRNELDYRQGPGLLLPHLASYRGLSRLLSAEARRQAADGDSAGAWRTALTGLRFADALREEPILISQLVRMAQMDLAAKAIRSMAVMAPPAVGDLAELDRRLVAVEDTAPAILGFDGERLLCGEWVWDHPLSPLLDLQGEGVTRSSLFFSAYPTILRPAYIRDHAAYLSVMRVYTRMAAQPWSRDDGSLGDRLVDDVPRYCILTRMLTPALGAYKKRCVATTAAARVTRVGLAVLRHKQEKGAYPASLAELNLGEMKDPFSGQPLIYRPSATGFLLYSLGANLTDEGGTESKSMDSGDIVWRYDQYRP